MAEQTWIFLRGLARETSAWGEFPRLFEETNPQSRVYCLDLPGNGERFREPTPLDVEGIVREVRREWSALCHKKKLAASPVSLLAISLGGMVATHWASRHPDEIERLVLINSSLRGLNPVLQRLTPGALGFLAKTAFISVPREREASILAFTTTKKDHPPGHLDELEAAARHRPISLVNTVRQLVAGARFSAPAKPPRTRILVVNSRQDRLADPRCSEAIASAWNAPLVTHPWGGHDLTLDDPRWVAEAVRDWSAASLTKR